MITAKEKSGAKLLQSRYGAHIVMGAGDWDLVDQSVNGFPAGKPKREFSKPAPNQALLDDITVKYREALTDAMNTQKYAKIDSYARIDALHNDRIRT